MKTKLLIVFAITIALLAMSFALQNTQVADINFLTWSFSMPIVLLVVCAFGLGFILALAIAVPGNLIKKIQMFGLRFKVRSLEKKGKKKDKVIEAGVTPPNLPLD